MCPTQPVTIEDIMSQPRRRTILRTLGTTLTAITAGCFGTTNPATGTTPTTGIASAPDTETAPATPSIGGELTADGTWPTFQYNNDNIGYNPAAAPLTDAELAWHVPTNGPGRFISPVVSDGRVYLQERWQDTTRATARRLKTGELLWARKHPDGGVGTAPAVAGESVIFTATQVVYAVTADGGDRRWTATPDGHPLTAPAVVNDTIIVTSRQGHQDEETAGIHAFDADSGTQQWCYLVDTDIRAAATVTDDAVLVPDTNGTVHAVNTVDGRARWTTTIESPVKTTPSLADGTIYFTDVDGHTHALAITDGSELWRTTTGPPSRGTGLAVADGTVYIGGGNRLYALKAESGGIEWTHQLSDNISTPAVGGDIVYIGDESQVLGIDAATGESRWTHHLPRVTDSDVAYGGLSTAPAPIDGGVLIHADDGLYSFGE